ncbi:LysR family transcriptional regulator [Curtobacterium sp. MCBD17_034]|uniref:LysR family transcriptional regulator n=1 Tax=unclassified Curtobacterium TaxID=257496 RepID=UPI000DA98FF2|nr:MULTISPECIES: LysR substrate-binding domain-containing protein [unclassified Curtobacterium]PZE76686.1 LysR family transcriptional regulator [Curtobacterium sp. MCBD17_019]PZF61077.1 LysR family transcriptional regulator [Curtobacterium sp. MCBD17_034]PZF66191.1 LysR family transcriptional regulator [Curtobacterium sp. MCBD17_013]PZM40427.1 LysR family transcriptional regulator [Curtobacterium sp. MCBD17_031]WIB64734.1 LysR substrate-binding domain-containing protein [Curtobacterium sp. MCB
MLDPILLRTFLTVAETLSFTQAAGRLGISQPTVSQHVRKLETAVSRTLLVRDTRGVALTDNGDAMAGFARTILAAHGQADAYFSGQANRGRLRFGAADDLAITQLPRILRDFRRLHPHINLELTVNQSGPLLRRLKAGQLDLVFIKQTAGQPAEGTRVASDQMVWMAQDGIALEPNEPVPLIAYQAPSISRQMAIDALEAVGRTWRITCNTRDVNGVLAAVRAGIGVAVFPHSLIPADLVKVSQRLVLPDLPAVDYVLMANPAAGRGPVDALTNAILSRGVIRAV